MPVFGVDVGVALHRPFGVHEYRRVVVEAADGDDAELLACLISWCTSKAVTESTVTDWPEETRLVDPARLVGLTDIGDRYGVSKTAVSNWEMRYRDFPEPVRVISGSIPVWLLDDIEAWYLNRWPNRKEAV